MTGCASCGAEGGSPGAACPSCGAKPVPDLDLPAPGSTSAANPPVSSAAADSVDVQSQQAAAPIELAVDPRALMPVAREASRSVRPPRSTLAVGDLAFDARLLADHGSAPQGWALAPVYAWRVLRRKRELRLALVERRAEAARTATEAEDALVAFAERVRPGAEKQPTYARAIEELRRAEDLLRSRDRVLATEQDAQKARIAQVDTRLAKLEEGLSQARVDERTTAGALAAAQAALAREEAKLKRAEMELRAAQQRESSGEVG
jgi:hypothetical protein